MGPRILLVRLGAIGDALRVLPALRRLRVDLPQAEIGWAVENWVHPILTGNPNVDRFHVLDRKALAGGWSAIAETGRFVAELRAVGYDVAVDLQGRFKSGVVSLASGAPRRLGYAHGDGSEGSFVFANERVTLPDTRENRVQRFLHLMQPLGVRPEPVPGDLGVHLEPERIEQAGNWYDSAGAPEVAAYPGSSLHRARYQRWQPERWAELLARLRSQGLRSTVFWGPNEEDYVDQIMARVEGVARAPKTTLPEMMAMLGRYRVFVGSNTAAMHMAWLQGVPVAFFPGPARPRTDAPFGGVPYRALWAGEHFSETASKGSQSACVLEVGVDEAERAVLSLLGEGLRDRGE